MKRTHFFWALSALCSTSIMAMPARAQAPQPATGSTSSTTTAPETFGQGVLFPVSLFDTALNERVNKEGEVNYAQLKGDENLEKFVRAVAAADVTKFPVFKAAPVEEANPNATKKEQAPQDDRSWELAFWINAYNAHFIKAIADAYPLSNVTTVKDFDKARTRVVAGQNLSFEQMRAKIAAFDPRALFALIDGTKSGPAMASQAYRWTGLSTLLDANISGFMNHPNNVQLTRIQNKVAVSEFLASVDEAFKPKGARRKWDGIRWLLTTYTQQRADRNFYAANEYEVLFTPRTYDLNNWTHSDD